MEPNYSIFEKEKNEAEAAWSFIEKSEQLKTYLRNLMNRYQFENPKELVFEIAARLSNNRLSLAADDECNGTAAGSAIYLETAMLNHSCQPNCIYTITRGNKLLVRTVDHIDAGEQLFISCQA